MFCPPFRLAVKWRKPRGEHGAFSRDAALKVTGVSSALLCSDGDDPVVRSVSQCYCHVLRSGHNGRQRSTVMTAVGAQHILYLTVSDGSCVDRSAAKFK